MEPLPPFSSHLNHYGFIHPPSQTAMDVSIRLCWDVYKRQVVGFTSISEAELHSRKESYIIIKLLRKHEIIWNLLKT